MIDYIGRTVLLVSDYDEAVRFYREKLGFEMLFDQRLESGFRAVHIGLPGQPGVGLWLNEARDDDSAALIGNQSSGGPFLVMYTADCRAACAQLESRGVPLLRQPQQEPGSIYAHFADLYANEIVLVELLDAGQREPTGA